MKLNYDDNWLKYKKTSDYCILWCTHDESIRASSDVLNEFLVEISTNNKVFIHTYRLPYEDVPKIINQSSVITKSQVLQDPFNTFFYLSEAKINSALLNNACEFIVYFFNRRVEWTEFLATSPIPTLKYKKMIKDGLLSACFMSVDHGADIWFECSQELFGETFCLIKNMSNLGWKVKKSPLLTFPNAM